jgi:transposase-like protein
MTVCFYRPKIDPGQSIVAVAKELGVKHQSLRNRIKAAVTGKRGGTGSKAIKQEQEAFPRLRVKKYD